MQTKELVSEEVFIKRNNLWRLRRESNRSVVALDSILAFHSDNSDRNTKLRELWPSLLCTRWKEINSIKQNWPKKKPGTTTLVTELVKWKMKRVRPWRQASRNTSRLLRKNLLDSFEVSVLIFAKVSFLSPLGGNLQCQKAPTKRCCWLCCSKKEEIVPRLCEHGDGWTCFRRLGLNYAPFDTESRSGACELHWVHTHRYNGTSWTTLQSPSRLHWKGVRRVLTDRTADWPSLPLGFPLGLTMKEERTKQGWFKKKKKKKVWPDLFCLFLPSIQYRKNTWFGHSGVSVLGRTFLSING